MRARTLLWLAAAAVAALAVAVLMDRTPGVQAPEAGERLLPALADHVNEVDEVRLALDQGAPAVTLYQEEGAWRVAQAHGYYADAGEIRRLLLGLARAVIVEPKTTNPEYYPRLGLADPGSGEGAGIGLTLLGAELPYVVVGQREAQGRGTYVRSADRPGTYLVDAVLDPATDPQQWLDKALLDIQADAIQSIEVTHADGGRLVLGRGEDGELAVAEVPDGRESTGPAAAQALSRALTGLRLEAVRPAAEFDPGEPAAVTEYRLDEDKLVRVRAWRVDDARWIAIEDGDPRHEGWVYRIPTHKYDLIVRRVEDMTREAAPAAGG